MAIKWICCCYNHPTFRRAVINSFEDKAAFLLVLLSFFDVASFVWHFFSNFTF